MDGRLGSGTAGLSAADDPRKPLPVLVAERCQNQPNAAALTSADSGETATWAQLAAGGIRWARWLAEAGVTREDRVVTLVPQSLDAAYLWLGACELGAVEVSVNSEFRGTWLAHALRASRATVAVVAKRYLAPVEAVVAETGIRTLLVHDAEPEERFESCVTVDPSGPDADRGHVTYERHTPTVSDIACILYTSGTTGPSKAVQLPWGLLHAQVSCDPLESPGDEIFYVPYAPYHLSGRGALYRGAITGGHTVVRRGFSASGFWGDVRRYGCTWTLLYAAPTRFLAAEAKRPDDADNPLRRVLMCPLVPEVDELKMRFGFDVYSVWGMTETGSPLVLPVELGDGQNVGSCGHPVEGVEARLVDSLDYPVPQGHLGELVLRSDLPWRFMVGYQGDAEATAATLRNGWFHTGDVFVEKPDGTFWYVDRRKDMIRRRGENVSSFELEAAVTAYGGITAVAAVGLPSALGDEEILVAVVPQHPEAFSAGGLYDHLVRTAPRFALPSHIRVMTELPRTQATNRVQKHDLRRVGVTDDTWRVADHRPEQRRPRSEGEG